MEFQEKMLFTDLYNEYWGNNNYWEIVIYLVKQNYIFFEYQFFQVKNVKKKHIHCNLTSFYVGIK